MAPRGTTKNIFDTIQQNKLPHDIYLPSKIAHKLTGKITMEASTLIILGVSGRLSTTPARWGEGEKGGRQEKGRNLAVNNQRKHAIIK